MEQTQCVPASRESITLPPNWFLGTKQTWKFNPCHKVADAENLRPKIYPPQRSALARLVEFIDIAVSIDPALVSSTHREGMWRWVFIRDWNTWLIDYLIICFAAGYYLPSALFSKCSKISTFFLAFWQTTKKSPKLFRSGGSTLYLRFLLCV